MRRTPFQCLNEERRETRTKQLNAVHMLVVRLIR